MKGGGLLWVCWISAIKLSTGMVSIGSGYLLWYHMVLVSLFLLVIFQSLFLVLTMWSVFLSEHGYSLRLYPSSVVGIASRVFLYDGRVVRVGRYRTVVDFCSSVLGVKYSRCYSAFCRGLSLADVLSSDFSSGSRCSGSVELFGVSYPNVNAVACAFGFTAVRVRTVLGVQGKYPATLLKSYLAGNASKFRPVQDADGLWHLNTAEMGRHYGVSNLVAARWLKEGTVGGVRAHSSPRQVTVRGVTYPSHSAASIALGYSGQAQFTQRVTAFQKLGVPLDYLADWVDVKGGCNPIQDPLTGTWYFNQSYLCEEYGLSLPQLRGRLSSGVTLGVALSLSGRAVEVVFFGVSYPSLSAFARAYDSTVAKVRRVLAEVDNYPKELLERYLRSSYRQFHPIQDSDGVWFINGVEYAQHYGLSKSSAHRVLSGGAAVCRRIEV